MSQQPMTYRLEVQAIENHIITIVRYMFLDRKGTNISTSTNQGSDGTDKVHLTHGQTQWPRPSQ
jgi:hypothetical protein